LASAALAFACYNFYYAAKANQDRVPATTECRIQSALWWDDAQGGQGCIIKATYGRNFSAGPREYYPHNWDDYQNNETKCKGENYMHFNSSLTCWYMPKSGELLYDNEKDALRETKSTLIWGISIGLFSTLIAFCCCSAMIDCKRNDAKAEDYVRLNS